MRDTYRPPISKKRQAMLDEIAARLTADGVMEFTRHNALDLAIDRAYAALFPGEQLPEHKRYIKLPF